MHHLKTVLQSSKFHPVFIDRLHQLALPRTPSSNSFSPRSSPMSKTNRSISDYFAKKPASTVAAASLPDGQQPPPATSDAAERETKRPRLDTTENAKENEAPVAAPAPGPGSSMTEEQRLRAETNRQIALSKQYVRQAEERAAAALLKGAPQLRDLVVDPGWSNVLHVEFDKPYMAKVQVMLESEWKGSTPIFPPPGSIFRAFNATPLDRVKVVILGQDPYHDVGQAMGLCFSVPQGQKVPSSLQNMYKELKSDLGSFTPPPHGNLEKWAHQGVFLLNTVLTVRAHQANSHAKKGWEVFTDAAIRAISATAADGVVFLLWGKQAQDKQGLIDKKRHHVLAAPHPSGLSAHRGFYGCKHFSQCNELLRKGGKQPIDWQI